MSEVEYLILAVRNRYRNRKDYSIIEAYLEVMYGSERITLPLNGILLIGY